MLGSIDDADDLVQDTLIAAWRGLTGFEGRSSVRAWLYQIATNRCLNAIRDGKRHPVTAPIPPFDPPTPNHTVDVPWLQPYPDSWLPGTGAASARHEARETVELAFVAALQLLPPRQTAALLLCDVMGFAMAEVADMLDTSQTTVKGLLQRARAAVARTTPAAPSPRTDAEEGDARLARRFAEAFTADDVAGVVALLTDDAWLAMPPALHEYRGRTAISSFLQASADWRAGRGLRLVPTRANTQPAFGCYLPDPDAGTAQATGLIVLTVGDSIRGITRFLDPRLPQRFGLPEVLDLAT